jgi:hypothetical protein
VLHATQGGSRRGAISATWDGKPERDGGRMKLRGRTFTSGSYLSVRGPMYSYDGTSGRREDVRLRLAAHKYALLPVCAETECQQVRQPKVSAARSIYTTMQAFSSRALGVA